MSVCSILMHKFNKSCTFILTFFFLFLFFFLSFFNVFLFKLCLQRLHCIVGNDTRDVLIHMTICTCRRKDDHIKLQCQVGYMQSIMQQDWVALHLRTMSVNLFVPPMFAVMTIYDNIPHFYADHHSRTIELSDCYLPWYFLVYSDPDARALGCRD